MNKNNSITKLFDNPKCTKIAIIVGIIAIALIFLSSFVDLSVFNNDSDIDEYAQSLEDKLLSIVTHIDGVGRAEIFLTLDNSGENVYLSNTDTKTKSITPIVRGVVVVCDGGDNPEVISEVMSAVTKSLDIPTNKVCVTKLKNQLEEQI